MLDQDNSFYLISFKYPNFLIQHPGCLFTYDISREGTYLKQGADQGKGAYFFLEIKQNVQNKVLKTKLFV